MQFPGQTPVVGVIYLTTMSRADSALALALLYGLQGKREARVAAVAVSGAGLETAAFCDAVGRFYAGPGPAANSNRTLPVGLAAVTPLPADSPMVKAVMARRNEKGESPYVHSLRNVSDTSEPVALIRNAITAQADGKAAVILSSPATDLAKVLDLLGIRELITAKVSVLVICDCGESQDVPAMERLLREWPTQIVFCGGDVGAAVTFPAAGVEKDFAWSLAHPVADAYRSYRKMPFDAPTTDMAAVLYTVRPKATLFQLSNPGTIQVGLDGKLTFVSALDGKHRSLSVDIGKAETIRSEYAQIASAKPVPRQSFRPPVPKAPEPAKPATVNPTAPAIPDKPLV